jgi:hypothetical protein
MGRTWRLGQGLFQLLVMAGQLELNPAKTDVTRALFHSPSLL